MLSNFIELTVDKYTMYSLHATVSAHINGSLVPRPSLTAFFVAVARSLAWVRPGSKHHVMLAIAYVSCNVKE